MKTLTKRAVIYARVSTDEQAEHGFSLPSQIDACRKYAQTNGLSVVGEYKDDFTGATLERPEFSKIRALVRAREVDAIIIYCADRLTRNLAHSLILRDEFEQAGVERHYAMRGRSENTPENRMLENIEGVFAEYEREKIRERMTRGKMQKAASGRFVGNGKVPYGYHRTDDQLEIYEPEAEVIRKIYDLYLNGLNGKDMSLRGITRWLSENGIPTPADSGNTNHVRKSKCWCLYTVRLFLESEAYTGVYRYGRYIGFCGRGGMRPIENQVVLNIPAIIDRSTWEKSVHKMRSVQHSSYNKRVVYEYMLRGMIKCGQCGHSMCGAGRRDWRDPKIFRGYYRCNQSSHRQKKLEYVCPAGYVSAELVEEAVWSFVLDLLQGNGFESILREAQQQEFNTQEHRIEEMQRTQRLIQACEREADSLVATMAKVNSPLFSKSIQEQVDMLEKRHAALIASRTELELLISATAVTDEHIAVALEFRDDVVRGLNNPTIEDKRRFLQILQTSVMVNENTATITLHIPRQTRSISLEEKAPQRKEKGKSMSAMTGISRPRARPCSRSRRW